MLDHSAGDDAQATLGDLFGTGAMGLEMGRRVIDLILRPDPERYKGDPFVLVSLPKFLLEGWQSI